MKLMLDERVKHRLIGFAVIISLAAIFAPAIMKKSNQRFDKEIGMRVELPPKPELPKVAVADQKQLFKTVKIAHVQLPQATSAQESSQLAAIEHKIPLEAIAKEVDNNFLAPIPAVKKAEVAQSESETKAKTVDKTSLLSKKPAVIASKVIERKPILLALNQEIYSVQLASFARRENAQVLVNRLRAKGYTGKIVKISGKNGDQFKVYVGRSNKKEQALKLKNQLAAAMRLSGFVVSGVG